MKYPPRPIKPERSTDCKCGHMYHEHECSILSYLTLELFYVLYAHKCEKCMCPHYKQEKKYFVFNNEQQKVGTG